MMIQQRELTPAEIIVLEVIRRTMSNCHGNGQMARFILEIDLSVGLVRIYEGQPRGRFEIRQLTTVDR
jgi:hypothetical protein